MKLSEENPGVCERYPGKEEWEEGRKSSWCDDRQDSEYKKARVGWWEMTFNVREDSQKGVLVARWELGAVISEHQGYIP